MAKKQKDGRYRAKITIGHTRDGDPITKYVSGKTMRELEAAKQEAISYYMDGAMHRQDMLFAEFAQEWYVTKKAPTIKNEGTRASYIYYINDHVLPEFGGRMMRAIRPLDIQEWLNTYAMRSKTFVNMLRSIVKNIFKTAYAEGIISFDPASSLSLPQIKPPEEKRAFTDEECARIESTISTHEHGAFLAVLYYLGLRRGEALGLKWGDFDWKKNLVRIQRDIDYTISTAGEVGELKTKAAYRTVPVPTPLRSCLYPLRGLPDVFLFCGVRGNAHISKTTYQRRFMSLMISCGFATEVKRKQNEPKKNDIRFDWQCSITAHYFRHHYATTLYNAGIDPLIAMKILGHSSYAVTAKIYTHLDNTHIENAIDKINAQMQHKKVAEKLPEAQN